MCYLNTHLRDENTEVQRGKVTCARSQSVSGVKLGCGYQLHMGFRNCILRLEAISLNIGKNLKLPKITIIFNTNFKIRTM